MNFAIFLYFLIFLDNNIFAKTHVYLYKGHHGNKKKHFEKSHKYHLKKHNRHRAEKGVDDMRYTTIKYNNTKGRMNNKSSLYNLEGFSSEKRSWPYYLNSRYDLLNYEIFNIYFKEDAANRIQQNNNSNNNTPVDINAFSPVTSTVGNSTATITTSTNLTPLLKSLTETETFLSPGRYPHKLAPVSGSANGSFNPNASANLIQDSIGGDASSSATASASSLGLDQPSFGIYHQTPVNMQELGLINSYNSTLESSYNTFPDSDGASRSNIFNQELSGLDSSGNLTFSSTLIGFLGITLGSNSTGATDIITNISLGAAETILGQALPSSWDPANNILIGQSIKPFAGKLREILTQRSPEYNAVYSDSLFNTSYQATQNQLDTAVDAQTKMIALSIENNWNRYIQFNPGFIAPGLTQAASYSALINNVIGHNLTVLNLSSSAYGANTGGQLTFPINIASLLSASHISGPQNTSNVAIALVNAFNTKGSFATTVQYTNLTFTYVNDGGGNYHFTVDKSPINSNPSFPSIFHYMAYHGSSAPNIVPSDLGTWWVNDAGRVMNGNVDTGKLAFESTQITVPSANIINYNSLSNYTYSGTTTDTLYISPNVSSGGPSQTIVTPTSNLNSPVSYTTAGSIIDLSSFNIPSANQSNSAFLDHLGVRWTDSSYTYVVGNTSSVSNLDANPTLIPSGKQYQLLYFPNLKWSDGSLTAGKVFSITTAAGLSTTPSFVINVTQSGSNNTSVFGSNGIDVTDFRFSQPTLANNYLVDVSAATNVSLWLDTNISAVNMAKGNNLIFGTDRSDKFYLNQDSISGSKNMISNTNKNLDSLSYVIIPPSFNVSNLKIHDLSSFYNKADQSSVSASAYSPYSYFWSITFNNGSNTHKIDMVANGDYNYSSVAQNDLAHLSIVEHEIFALPNAITNVNQNYSLVHGTPGNDTFNVTASYANIEGKGGDDTFVFNPQSPDVTRVVDFSLGDKIDISNLTNYNATNISTSITTISAADHDYVINLKDQNNHEHRIYVDSDHAITENDFNLK